MALSSAEKVKNWRDSTKHRIVKAFDDKCGICGYDKCNNSLTLHHINPETKEFSFNRIRANPKSWKKIVNELRKCVMLCANCHNEIHAGMIKVPENIKRFDESYVDYKKINIPL
jgi:hypothetical protein